MFLQKEINEQPQVIARLYQEERDNIKQIAAAIRAFDPAFVVIAARGTSDNAARYAQYLFGAQAGLSVGLSAPSLHTLYQTPPTLKRALVIGISQSGQAEDVRRVLEDANKQGALTLAITNNIESPMAKTAQYHIDLMAGEEISIAATKTYTAQLMTIALLVAELVENDAMRAVLADLPRSIQTTLDYSADIPNWADRYRYMTQFATIGRGYNYATAFEISLKVKELCYITGEGYSEADFRHGPIATVGQGFPMVIVAPQGVVLPNVQDLINKLKERGAELLIISNDETVLAMGLQQMRVPVVPEWVSPIVTVIPGQVFAMQQALVRGYAVDKPRGLSKVTVTQ
ncbi:MAG: glucosamine--fructose-6-phosphate aminotransferase [Phototrophicales bacterium]|nr:MAG: glucosamine--fructose-6-phosphate aminotransferase [Phototrophicales bacterium]RMG69914.1 MAG: SIS domain-containing protein [Chloroflexota bacterium]